jgi:hypothetical protein
MVLIGFHFTRGLLPSTSPSGKDRLPWGAEPERLYGDRSACPMGVITNPDGEGVPRRITFSSLRDRSLRRYSRVPGGIPRTWRAAAVRIRKGAE